MKRHHESTYTDNPLRGSQAGNTTTTTSPFYVISRRKSHRIWKAPNGEAGILLALSPDLSCDGERSRLGVVHEDTSIRKWHGYQTEISEVIELMTRTIHHPSLKW